MSGLEGYGPEMEAEIKSMLRDLHDGFHTIPLTMSVILCNPAVVGRVQHIVDLAAHDPSHFTVRPYPHLGPATVQAIDEDALAKMAAEKLEEISNDGQ